VTQWARTAAQAAEGPPRMTAWPDAEFSETMGEALSPVVPPCRSNGIRRADLRCVPNTSDRTAHPSSYARAHTRPGMRVPTALRSIAFERAVAADACGGNAMRARTALLSSLSSNMPIASMSLIGPTTPTNPINALSTNLEAPVTRMDTTPHLDFDLDFDPLWHTLGSGACVAAALTLVRIGLDYAFRHGERRLENEDRRRAHQRDAEARLERLLQDRLSEVDRRLERCQLEVETERDRRCAVERDYAALLRAYELLEEHYAADHRHGQGSRARRTAVDEPAIVIDPTPLTHEHAKPQDAPQLRSSGPSDASRTPEPQVEGAAPATTQSATRESSRRPE
jgi:hypothetical protein